MNKHAEKATSSALNCLLALVITLCIVGFFQIGGYPSLVICPIIHFALTYFESTRIEKET